MSETKRMRWGLLASGRIAKTMAQNLKDLPDAELLAVASRDQAKADATARELGVSRAYGSYDALLADRDIDIVYIATPHPMHAEWIIKAADAGKHILCEKPLVMNAFDAQTVIEAARRNRVFLMEAFMYRCHPQTAKLVETIRSGTIGDVRLIEASFAFQCNHDPKSRIFDPALGGGGILDIGCYTVSMARLLAGAALGRPFAEPVDVKAIGHLRPDQPVDAWTMAMLKFDNDIMAHCVTGVEMRRASAVTVTGSKGIIEVPQPWYPSGREANQPYTFTIRPHEGEPVTVSEVVPYRIFANEARVVMQAIRDGRQEAPAPAMTWADTLGNMATLDRWRQAIGLTYPCETVEAYRQTLDRRPLRARPGNSMQYGKLPGLDKPISRLVMGVIGSNGIADAAARYDDFIARGGNAFDTAYIYGGGAAEKTLGTWLNNRNIRDSVVLIDKGAHTPNCFPDKLLSQFNESLERLQVDRLDVYFMHRDNPDIPVGEFVDVLNQLVNQKRLSVFGGSNWTLPRLEAANDWARQHRKQGFSAISNNLSLARMINPVWDGCIAASEPPLREWHERTQFPLFAWSSQARGFFVPERSAPHLQSDTSLVHSWYSPENFQRQARCFELAKKRNVHPISIALAYVLNQAFPVFALIGPATIQEILPSEQALNIKLTPQELAWLDLRA